VVRNSLIPYKTILKFEDVSEWSILLKHKMTSVIFMQYQNYKCFCCLLRIVSLNCDCNIWLKIEMNLPSIISAFLFRFCQIILVLLIPWGVSSMARAWLCNLNSRDEIQIPYGTFAPLLITILIPTLLFLLGHLMVYSVCLTVLLLTMRNLY
jgi:hypothetical protein